MKNKARSKTWWELTVWVFDVEDEVVDKAARATGSSGGFAFASRARDLVYEYKTEVGARRAEGRVHAALGGTEHYTDIQRRPEPECGPGEVRELIAIVPRRHGVAYDRALSKAAGRPPDGTSLFENDRVLWWRFPFQVDLAPRRKKLRALNVRGLRLRVRDASDLG